MSLLGIDIGTSTCKAAAFSLDGRQISFASREYPGIHRGNGVAELDSRKVFSLVCECIRKVSSECGRDPVAALCVSSMGEAAIPVSREKGILGNSILSMDVRGSEYIERLSRDICEEDFFAVNANILSPAYSYPKLAWLRDNQPDIYSMTEHFVLWDGLLGYLCGCEPFISYPSASRTLLFDIQKADWSEKLLEIGGMERGKLPRCLASGTPVGNVGRKMAEELGLQEKAVIIVGGHDQCCNALGCGGIVPGRTVYGLGSFDCITPIFRRPADALAMFRADLNFEHHVLPDLYVSFLYNQAGLMVKWFRETFAAHEPEAGLYDALLSEMPAVPSRLIVLPQFDPPPHHPPDTAGVIAGLRYDSSRGEILKAILEGIALHFVEGLDTLRHLGIDTACLIASGGGAKSAAGLQVRADVLGIPIVRPAIIEAGVLGASMLAGLGTGILRSPQEAVDLFVHENRVFTPDPVRHDFYRERHGLYRQMRDGLAPVLSGLHEGMSHD